MCSYSCLVIVIAISSVKTDVIITVEGDYCNIFRIAANALSKAFKTMLSVVETFDRVELGIQYQNAVKNRSHNLVIDHLDI